MASGSWFKPTSQDQKSIVISSMVSDFGFHFGFNIQANGQSAHCKLNATNWYEVNDSTCIMLK
jgi:hypothetical protein